MLQADYNLFQARLPVDLPMYARDVQEGSDFKPSTKKIETNRLDAASRPGSNRS